MAPFALSPHPIPELVDREHTIREPVSIYRMALTAGFTFALVLASILISVKTFSIDGVLLPASTIIFPLAFSILVIVSEVYGLQTSWRLAVTGVVLLFLLIVVMAAQIIAIAVALPLALWGRATPDVMAAVLWNRTLFAFFQSSLAAPFLFWAMLAIRRRERHQTPANDKITPGHIWESTVTITLDSIIVDANHAFAAMFDCPDPLGRSLTDFMPERMRGPHMAGMARYRETGTRTLNWANVPVTGLRGDGTELALLVSFLDRVTDPPRLTGIIRFAGALTPVANGDTEESLC